MERVVLPVVLAVAAFPGVFCAVQSRRSPAVYLPFRTIGKPSAPISSERTAAGSGTGW